LCRTYAFITILTVYYTSFFLLIVVSYCDAGAYVQPVVIGEAFDRGLHCWHAAAVVEW